MWLLAETTVELWVALAALLTSLGGAAVALAKLGPERQVSIVGAQDTVIDNLREEVDRHRQERQSEIAALESRYRVRIAELERSLAEEAETCERKISELQHRIAMLERSVTND